MKSYRSISLTIVLSILVSASCAKDKVPSSSSTAGALTANSSSTEAAAPRPFDRHMLSVSGLSSMTEFIRPEIRNRLDEEPTGDSDSGYEPGAMESAPAGEQAPAENAEAERPEAQQEQAADEDTSPRSDSGRFLWARKAFGDAVKAHPANGGVIVLFADENYYDVNALMSHLEAGRDRISSAAQIGGERLQVVFGGYRATPQVELWVIPPGGSMPEFKTDDRNKAADPE